MARTKNLKRRREREQNPDEMAAPVETERNEEVEVSKEALNPDPDEVGLHGDGEREREEEEKEKEDKEDEEKEPEEKESEEKDEGGENENRENEVVNENDNEENEVVDENENEEEDDEGRSPSRTVSDPIDPPFDPPIDVEPPPASKKSVHVLDPEERKTLRKAINAANSNAVRAKLLKGFKCQICWQVMTRPVTTPCGHNFCKGCVVSKFAGQTLMRERNKGGRTLRAQKNVMKCPCCPTDISDFLQNPQVNIEIMGVIESLKNNEEDNTKAVDEGEGSGTDPEEEKGEGSGTDPEEETLVVSEEAEQPKKRIKLDTDAAVV